MTPVADTNNWCEHKLEHKWLEHKWLEPKWCLSQNVCLVSQTIFDLLEKFRNNRNIFHFFARTIQKAKFVFCIMYKLHNSYFVFL